MGIIIQDNTSGKQKSDRNKKDGQRYLIRLREMSINLLAKLVFYNNSHAQRYGYWAILDFCPSIK